MWLEMADRQHDLSEAIAYYYDKPAAFAEDLLGVTPDPEQAEVMQSVADNRLTSVRAGHGVGKSALTSWLVLWFLMTRPYPLIPCTAPKESQLFDILWRECSHWLEQSKIKQWIKWSAEKIYLDGHKSDWYAMPRTSSQPENMAGFHADHMLFVVDEASGVADANFEVIMGALSGQDNKLLMIGNPTRTSGFFFDSHNKDRALFSTFHMDAEASPRVSKATISFFKKKYGEGSNAYAVRVRGEFPAGEDDAFITLADTMAAVDRDNIESSDVVEIGCDVARFGDDETVIASREGMAVAPLKTYHGASTMETVGNLVRECRRLMAIHPGVTIAVKIDDTGVGGGVTDRMKEIIESDNLPVDVLPINFGSRGNDEYDGIVSEMYGNFKDHCLKVCRLPNDEDLIAQLSTRKYTITSAGKIKIEEKSAMKRRGLHSPDRAEAVIMAFAQPEKGQGAAFLQFMKNELDKQKAEKGG